MRVVRVGIGTLLLAAALAGGSSGFAADKTYHYWPAVVQLSGVIVRAWSYGAPNFGEDPKHDHKDRYQVLVVNAPITVIGDPEDLHDGLNAETFHHVRRIQLNFPSSQEKASGSTFVGRHVMVTRTLFERILGPHHTRVLMDVESVTPAKPAK